MDTSRGTVLLVDDDDDFLAMGARALRAAGFSVHEAGDREEAFRCLDGLRPDVIVSDLMMGSLDDGFALARDIKHDARFTSVPVLIITSASHTRGFDFRPRSGADLNAMHADAFLEKPVVPSCLVEAVAKLAAAKR